MAKNKIMGLGAGKFSISGSDASIGSIKRNLSIPHARNAVKRCISLWELQRDASTHTFSEHFEDYRSEWLSVLMSSAASGEAFVNEMIVRLGGDPDDPRWKKEPAHKKAKKYLKREFQKSLNLDEPAFKDFVKVISVRNAIMHFKPKYDDDNKTSSDLEMALPSLAQCPLLDDGAPFFPMRCVSFEFASWAVGSTLEFVRCLNELTDEGQYKKHFAKLESELAELED